MNDNQLKTKNDAVLISDLKNLVGEERKIILQVIHHLREVEKRRLYLKKGFSSLFAFCTEELGYSEASAQRRINAMRLVRDVPEVEEKIEAGKLSLSVASQIQGYLRKEEVRLRGGVGKSPLTRDLSTPPGGGNPLPQARKLALVKQLEGTSIRQCEKQLIELDPAMNLPREKARPITPDKTLIQFIANKDLMAKIAKLKSLLSHQNSEQRYDELFAQVVDMALDRLDPERRQARRMNKKAKIVTPAPEVEGTDTRVPGRNGRHIPMGLRDRIYTRDGGRCTYQDPHTGRRCNADYQLQLDHQWPYSLGGEHSEENLSLKCAVHNRMRYESLC